MLVAAALPTALVPPTATADTAPPDSSLPATVSSDALPSPQIDSAGVVWSQTVVGSTVYAGGSFTKARPAGAAAGTSEVSRKSLLAYNITTGALTSFAPAFNGQVLSVVASGTTLYVGGDFTLVGSTTRNHIAAFDTATGALTSFNPNVNNKVNALFIAAGTVYLGGPFSSVGGKSRHGSAAVSATTGIPTAFDPIISGGSVRAITGKSDGTRIVLGGAFNSVNGSNPSDKSKPGYGMVMLDPASSGVNLAMPVNSLIRDGSAGDGKAAIDTLSANPDGSGFFGGGFSFDKSQGNFEGSFQASWAGVLTEMEDCHGDTYSVFPQGKVLYVASHSHYCGNSGGFPQTNPFTFQRATAFTTVPRGVIGRDIYNYYSFEGQPRPELLNWFPDLTAGTTSTGSGQSQAAWSVAGNADYIVYGGEFPKVNNKAQQGLVRFARTGLAPNHDGPRLGGSTFKPSVKNFAQGIRVSWPANFDRDNEQLSYQLIKNGNTASPVFTRTVLSTFWRRPNIAFLDTSVSAGQSYSYRIKTIDPKGNSAYGDTVTITAGSGPSLSSYDQAALADGPQYYWPYNETSGSTAADIANGETGAVGSGVTKGDPGAISGSGEVVPVLRDQHGNRLDHNRPPGAADLQCGGVVQDDLVEWREDHWLREPAVRALDALRPAAVSGQHRPRLLRGEPQREEGPHQPLDLPQRRLAPRRRHTQPGRPVPVCRRRQGGLRHGEDLQRPGQHRLLAGRRRRHERLVRRWQQSLSRRQHRQPRCVSDRLERFAGRRTLRGQNQLDHAERARTIAGSRAADLQEEMVEHALRFTRSDEDGGSKRDPPPERSGGHVIARRRSAAGDGETRSSFHQIRRRRRVQARSAAGAERRPCHRAPPICRRRW